MAYVNCLQHPEIFSVISIDNAREITHRALGQIKQQ